MTKAVFVFFVSFIISFMLWKEYIFYWSVCPKCGYRRVKIIFTKGEKYCFIDGTELVAKKYGRHECGHKILPSEVGRYCPKCGKIIELGYNS